MPKLNENKMLLYAGFMCESDMIENINIPIPEYIHALKFRSKNNRPRKATDYFKRYVDCHVSGLFFVLDNAFKLPTIFTTLSLHGLIMETEPNKKPGQFRPYDVEVGSYLCPNHKKVPYLMEDWTSKLTKECDPLIEHYRFEKIHPFCDGNGRSGRLLWLWMLLHKEQELNKTFLKDNYSAESSFRDNRISYYNALSKYNPEGMLL